ncbi:MAG: hypothetical protein LBS51_08310 [Oscillospiraceae bacterium]|nr:hypothetical protein [Oscillospiraceae bacterium]
MDDHGGYYEIPLVDSSTNDVKLADGQTATVIYSVLVDDALLTAFDLSNTKRLNGNGKVDPFEVIT